MCSSDLGLLHGSLVFDTVSILYVNSLFIVLSLVPLRLRERRWYGTMLFWLFSVANALALIVNVSDGVYYHYAKKGSPRTNSPTSVTTTIPEPYC